MSQNPHDKESSGASSARRAVSTRVVVESAIEAAKATNHQTWDDVAETSAEMKWDESEDDNCDDSETKSPLAV